MALRQLELVVAQPVEPEAAVVLLASRLVHRRIIGRVSFKRLALRFRLMPPAYVKRHKNDSVDAEANCEDRQN
jgi:hypothetical protein